MSAHHRPLRRQQDASNFLAGLNSRPRFLSILLLLAAAYLVLMQPRMWGDVDEYVPTVVALASHASPDVRVSDLLMAKSIMPEHAPLLDQAAQAMLAGNPLPRPGIILGSDGRYYSIHFFGYSALAAVPFKLLQAAGLVPRRFFELVNVACMLVLGMALLRYLSSGPAALAALALFLSCGGIFYGSWSSPEALTAAGLLSAMLFLFTGAPMAAGLLAGLASMQNPPVVMFFFFGPALLVASRAGSGMPWKEALATLCHRRLALGLAVGILLSGAPVAFNWVEFGTPSLIAKTGTDPALIGFARLRSFFFDLNQGMIIGIPGIVLALALTAWRGRRAGRPVRWGPWLVAVSFTVCMAIPALTTRNWNSAAIGPMRYAFWASMPLLFLLLHGLRLGRPSRWILAAALVVQALALFHMTRYSYLQFSPLARLVFNRMPSAYNPDPEIFAERLLGAENALHKSRVFTYRAASGTTKTLYHGGNLDLDAQLCGPARVVSPPAQIASAGWDYIDGPVQCAPAAADALPQTLRYPARALLAHSGVELGPGWSSVSLGGGEWDGVWSVGDRSQMTIRAQPGYRATIVVLSGGYFASNHRTRVTVNGRDYGWLDLSASPPILHTPDAKSSLLTIDLQHQAPVAPGRGDTRLVALFLRQVSVREQR